MIDRKNLIAKLKRAKKSTNQLDVAVEIALFNPEVAIRANAAGTKVIVTFKDGTESTHWARDWSMEANRARAIELLSKGEP